MATIFLGFQCDLGLIVVLHKYFFRWDCKIYLVTCPPKQETMERVTLKHQHPGSYGSQLLVLLGSKTTHYCEVIMSAMASQIIGASMVCSTVCSDADQTWKMFPFDDIIMWKYCWLGVILVRGDKRRCNWNQNGKIRENAVWISSEKWRQFSSGFNVI